MNRGMKDIRECQMECLKKIFLKKYHSTETCKVRMIRLRKIWKKSIPRRGTNKCLGLSVGKESLYLRDSVGACVAGACEEGRMV